MKHKITIGFFLFLVFSSIFVAPKSYGQYLPVDSVSVVDSVAVRDSLARVALFESLDNNLKNSQIILSPYKALNYLKIEFDSTLKRGSQDLFFGIDDIGYQQKQSLLQDGLEKDNRPAWVLLIVFLLFLVLGVLRIVFPVELKIIVDAYYKERLLLQVSKEDNLATSWPYIFLYAVFSLSLGLFVVVIVSSFGDKNYLTFENFLKNSGLIALLFIAKILLIRFVSFVFQLDKIVREYIAILYLVYFNSMFFLMPFLLAVVFIPANYFQLISIIYIVIVIILFSYRFIRTAFHLFGHFKFSIFYLILYLCSLELAPILILVRSLSN